MAWLPARSSASPGSSVSWLAWSRPFKSEQSSVAELVHGSMTTPSMLSESSAICMAEARSRSAMGRLAVPLSASAIFTEVNTGR